MDDDGKDNNYMRESDNDESGSSDGDMSLVDESPMDLEIKASGPKL
ncbi:hypothetical protein WN944_014655 [Citrus x changshan-huyou]|uniref:Uncharacterized protein n=1 Tax=Citrus x changshan-huyou TaxID=2935761 RepID=A0AAP0M653_9ROSI